MILAGNELRETRAAASRVGILIGNETRDIRCEDNKFEGFATDVSDQSNKTKVSPAK